MNFPGLDLNDGYSLPAVGLGTFDLHGQTAIELISKSLDLGYRLVDTALAYGNEAEVGSAVKAASVARENVTVETKVPGRHHGYHATMESCEKSLLNLGLDQIDLYLIHWPNPHLGKYLDTWRAMIRLRERGLVRSIGVSNFTIPLLEELIAAEGVTPAVNQIELHPYFPQDELRDFHASHQIRTLGWAPLAQSSGVLAEWPVVRAAENHDVTPAQVVLRWHTQIGSVPIPKTASLQRAAANVDIFGFTLSDTEIREISSLERGRLWESNPATHEVL